MAFATYQEGEFGVPASVVRLVENGYYALKIRQDADYTFVRVSRPEYGPHKGSIKVQTQHGERLRDVFFLEADGTFSVQNGDIRNLMIMLVSETRRAAVAYGRTVGYCCRCGKPLTDRISRHYGIGPDCRELWPEIAEMVDAEELPEDASQEE